MLNRPRDRWNASDLAIAAHLARAQADAERLQAEIAVEGDLLGVSLNPKHRLLETVIKRIERLVRLLHLHPEATIGPAREETKALAVEAGMREIERDPLIPLS